MPQMVLNDEQARLALTTRKPIQVCDSQGSVLGTFTPFWSEADIAEAKRRLESDEPRHPTEEVLAHLRSLESQSR